MRPSHLRLYLLLLVTVLLICPASPTQAAVGLTTLPNREGVRLTIYNAVDLTLVQDTRTLILRKGINRIQYQWSGTLIDPTSLELRAMESKDDLDIINVVYPQGTRDTLIWEIESQVEGRIPFEISYFTSGISWSADYVVRAAPDEATGELEGRVSIVNNSGALYDGARIRLVVGTINLVQQIRDLASGRVVTRRSRVRREQRPQMRRAMMDMPTSGAAYGELPAAPEVVSQRLSDYHLFSISGKHDLLAGGLSRYLAISTEEPMALEQLYRVNHMQNYATKLYRFINDEDHHLPDGPLPGGTWYIFRVTDVSTNALSYQGQVNMDYVPPNQKVEISLGADPSVSVRQRSLWQKNTDHHFNRYNRVDGWVEHKAYGFKLRNTRSLPISVEYLISPGGGEWKITGLQIEGERRSANLYRVRAKIQPGEELVLGPYVITHNKGERANRGYVVEPPGQPELPDVITKP